MGTPMPSFKDQLDNEKSWHLVNFIKSLSPSAERPVVEEIVKVAEVEGDIPMDFEDPKWQSAEKYFFPLLGQFQIEPRQFWTTIHDINVKALHNGEDIAFYFEWDDPSKSPLEPNKVYPLI